MTNNQRDRSQPTLHVRNAEGEAMRFGIRTKPGAGLLGLGAVALAVAAASPAAASAHASPVTGHVYVDDNTAGVNTIGAFDRHADGTLTPEPGSPFAAGGAGTGTGLASQGALQASPDGRFLIAADAGSNQISVLRILRDGSLRLVHGGVVSSRGVLPVSVAVHGDLVYVANAGAGGSNYTGFRLRHDGRLDPVPGSAVALPDGAQPGDVLFNGTGTRLAGTRVGTSQIDSFTVGSGGRLRPAPGSPFPAQGLGPFGSEFRPTQPDQLFVSNAHNPGAGSGTVSAFTDAADGTLTSIGSSPFADLQTAPCWVEITRDGRYLFTVNTASGSISRYRIAPGGALTLLGSTPVKSGAGAGAVDARLSPDGRTLYLDEAKAGTVGEFAVHGGDLTELPVSPAALPAGAAPAGIVVT
jgi:6-phosphogluconolactonase (cycloisomerase 2 family)